MRKVLLVLFFLLIVYGGYILYTNLFSKGIPKLETEEELINIDSLYIYGTHLNMEGNVVNDANMDLVLYNGEFISVPINIADGRFNLSNYINNGMSLENIDLGTYYAFLRSSSKDDDDKDVFKYYILNNVTDYKETTYYTFSNHDRKIIINSDEEYNTLTFNVTKNSDKEIYDIVIDPGHGGIDGGASKNGKKESDYTLKIADNLKEKLESYGIKVKLTRTDNQLSLNDKLPDYGIHGRAVINHEVNAKYVFSIHLNSNAYSSVHGLEIYTPDNIDYTFVKKLGSNIINMTDSNYSTNKINKVFDGIYTRTFTNSDIEDAIKENQNKGRLPYDVKLGANYYFMIRETGGIMTGAYVDDRNAPAVLENPYYNSNVGSEAYLLELAYLTNSNDLSNLDNNIDSYTNAIADTFNEIFSTVN